MQLTPSEDARRLLPYTRALSGDVRRFHHICSVHGLSRADARPAEAHFDMHEATLVSIHMRNLLRVHMQFIVTEPCMIRPAFI